MSIKALLFAGLGLFLSMTATAIWVGNDMARIKEAQRADPAGECAPASATGTSAAPTFDPDTGLPMDAAPTALASGCEPTAATPATSDAGLPAEESIAGEPVDDQLVEGAGTEAPADFVGGDESIELPTEEPVAVQEDIIDPAAQTDTAGLVADEAY